MRALLNAFDRHFASGRATIEMKAMDSRQLADVGLDGVNAAVVLRHRMSTSRSTALSALALTSNTKAAEASARVYS